MSEYVRSEAWLDGLWNSFFWLFKTRGTLPCHKTPKVGPRHIESKSSLWIPHGCQSSAGWAGESSIVGLRAGWDFSSMGPRPHLRLAGVGHTGRLARVSDRPVDMRTLRYHPPLPSCFPQTQASLKERVCCTRLGSSVTLWLLWPRPVYYSNFWKDRPLSFIYICCEVPCISGLHFWLYNICLVICASAAHELLSYTFHVVMW